MHYKSTAWLGYIAKITLCSFFSSWITGGLPDQNVNTQTINISGLTSGEHRYRVRPVRSLALAIGYDDRSRGQIFFDV